MLIDSKFKTNVAFGIYGAVVGILVPIINVSLTDAVQPYGIAPLFPHLFMFFAVPAVAYFVIWRLFQREAPQEGRITMFLIGYFVFYLIATLLYH